MNSSLWNQQALLDANQLALLDANQLALLDATPLSNKSYTLTSNVILHYGVTQFNTLNTKNLDFHRILFSHL